MYISIPTLGASNARVSFRFEDVTRCVTVLAVLFSLGCQDHSRTVSNGPAPEAPGCYRVSVQAWHPEVSFQPEGYFTPPGLVRLDAAAAEAQGWNAVWPVVGTADSGAVAHWQRRGADSLIVEWLSGPYSVHLAMRWDHELWRGTAQLGSAVEQDDERPWSPVSMTPMSCDSLQMPQ